MTFRATLVLAIALAGLAAGAAGAATFTVNDFVDEDGVCPSLDKCSLRTAIMTANAFPGADKVDFKLPANGMAVTITLLTKPLDAITETVSIDGTRGPSTGAGPNPGVVLDGSMLSGSAIGLEVAPGATATIKGLVIQGFGGAGIQIDAPAGPLAGPTATITGCYIGTSADGETAAQNGIGILINGASGNTIGGTGAAARNVISGNKDAGIEITGVMATSNLITGNSIGSNPTATAKVANGQGILITGNAGGTVIAGNLISGNTGDGVHFDTAGSSNQVIENNVGGQADATQDLGNGGHGILIDKTNLTAVGIQGDRAAGNVIMWNAGAGVAVTGNGVTNPIVFNSIAGNGHIGIDLNDDGVTANDSGDPDNGPNLLQNFPVIDAGGAWSMAGNSVVSGAFNSAANTTFSLQFFSSLSCAATNNRQGTTFLGAVNVTTDGSGNTRFRATLSPVAPDGAVTATATDLALGNTSEFSACVSAQECPTIGVPTILPDPIEGAAYSQMLAASGGAGPYGFVLSAGALPSGLTLSSAGLIAGTTSDRAARDFTVTVTDAHGCTGTQDFTLNAQCADITLMPASLPSATLGSPYSQMLTAMNGTAPRSFSVSAGALPPGLSLSASGAISGTPMMSGSFDFTATATDSATPACAGTQAYNIMVVALCTAAVIISPETLPAGTAGTRYSQMLSANGSPPHHFSLMSGALPPGLDVSSAGLISGTPTLAGSFDFTVGVVDSHGCTGQQSYTLVIGANCGVAPIVVAPATVPAGSVGMEYSATFSASGGMPPYTFTTMNASLPPGLSLEPISGVLDGTPGSAGNYSFVITATDAQGCQGGRHYDLSIAAQCPVVSLSPDKLAGGTTGMSYQQAVHASGGTGPYTFAITGGSAPPGLTLSPSGTLHGNPTTAGLYQITISATDANGCSGGRDYTIAVCAPISLAPASLDNGTLGSPYSVTISASGGSAPYRFALRSGRLPDGLAFDSGGHLTGTPTRTGSSSFIIGVNDELDCPGARSYALTIVGQTCPTLTLSPDHLSLATLGVGYQQTFTASGGAPPYQFTVTSGSLPLGMTLSLGGSLSGSPSDSGDFDFTVVATDSHGCTAALAYTLTVQLVCPAITVAPATLSPGNTGVAYHQALVVSGGAPPYTVVVSDGVLPPGLTLSSSGVINGTPTAAGSFGFAVTVSDANGCAGEQVYNLRITMPGCGNIAISPVSLPDAKVGTAYSQTLSAAGGSAPYTWSSTGALPAGLTLSAAGVLAGRPRVEGTASFAVIAKDTAGCSSARQYSLLTACPGSGCAAADAGPGAADAGAAGSDAGTPASDQSGCGCTVGGNHANGFSGLLIAMGVAAGLRRRRRASVTTPAD